MVSDYKATTFLAIMISVNILLYFAQGAIAYEDPDMTYVNLENSTAGQMMNSDGEFKAGVDGVEIETEAVDPDTGNVFTDTFEAIKGWFQDLEERFALLTGILKQPGGFMKQVGVPGPIRAGFSIIWYGIAIMLIIGFFRGGNQ